MELLEHLSVDFSSSQTQGLEVKLKLKNAYDTTYN